MNKVQILLITGIILYIIALYNYIPPQLAKVEQACDPNTAICVACPLYTPPPIRSQINAYTYITHENRFSGLVSAKDLVFRKAICKDYLNLVNSSLSPQKNEHLDQYYKSGMISMSESFSPLFYLIPNMLFLYKAEDFIIFTKGASSSQPQIYVEVPKNASNILKYSRILGWSSLLAIIIAAIATQLHFQTFTIDTFTPPLLEIIAIAFSLLYSDDEKFFLSFDLVQAMYFAVILLRVRDEVKMEKYFLALWIVVCTVQPWLVLGLQLYLSYHFATRRGELNFELSAVGAIILISTIMKLSQVLLPINFLAFLHILWSIIFLPIAFLIIQSSLSSRKYAEANSK